MRLIPITTALIASLAATVASASDLTLTLKNHQFSPQTLEIPANTKVTLTVINLSDEEITAAKVKPGVLSILRRWLQSSKK